MIRSLNKRTVVALLLAGIAGLNSARAHVPVPDGVLAPKTPAEAWNVLRLATANVERLLRENRLAELPDQASLCSPALRALPPWAAGSTDQTRRAAAQAVRAAVAVNTLAQAGVAGDRALALDSFGLLRGTLSQLASAYDPKAVAADIFTCPMHPDFTSVDAAARCSKCGMSLLTRRIPYSFVYVPPGEPTLVLTATSPTALVAGRESRVTVRLARRDGSPVRVADLLVTHTQPIHLLIVDPALEDYHHEHPTPTDIPGEYVFSFVPTNTSAYRIFADVVPADSGVQEYPFADLPGGGSGFASPPTRDRASTYASKAGGLDFRLSVEETDGSPPRAGQARGLRITVSDDEGRPVTALEPVMGAFAHLVGFYADGRTVVHLHPAGAEASDADARGGPGLDFKFYPPKAGFLRLYCQVRMGGRMIFAPFDMNVAP